MAGELLLLLTYHILGIIPFEICTGVNKQQTVSLRLLTLISVQD